MSDDRILEAISQDLARADAMKEAEKPHKWLTGEDLLKQGRESLPCLVEPILQKVGLACIAGSSDTGKSSFLRQLCYSVASDAERFLDFRLNAQYHSAIYVSTEDDESAMQFLLNKQNKDWNAYNEKFGRIRFLFDTTNLLQDLDSMLEETPADLVCIDAFTDLYSGELNKSNQVRCFLNGYSQLAQKHQCLVMFLHHCGKRTEEDKTPSKHNLLGSQAIEAKMRLVLELRSDNENPNLKHLCIVKGNYLPSTFKNESFVLSFSENMTFTDTQDRTPFEQLVKMPVGNPSKEDVIREKMATAKMLRKQGLTQQQIADAMNVNKSTVSRWFQDERINEIPDDADDEQ